MIEAETKMIDWWSSDVVERAVEAMLPAPPTWNLPPNQRAWQQLRNDVMKSAEAEKHLPRLRYNLYVFHGLLGLCRRHLQETHGPAFWDRVALAVRDSDFARKSLVLLRKLPCVCRHDAVNELLDLRAKGLRYRLPSGRWTTMRPADFGIETLVELSRAVMRFMSRPSNNGAQLANSGVALAQKLVVITMKVANGLLYVSSSHATHHGPTKGVTGHAMKLLMVLHSREYKEIAERSSQSYSADEYLFEQVWGARMDFATQPYKPRMARDGSGGPATVIRSLVYNVNEQLEKVLGASPNGKRWIFRSGKAYMLTPRVRWVMYAEPYRARPREVSYDPDVLNDMCAGRYANPSTNNT